MPEIEVVEEVVKPFSIGTLSRKRKKKGHNGREREVEREMEKEKEKEREKNEMKTRIETGSIVGLGQRR